MTPKSPKFVFTAAWARDLREGMYVAEMNRPKSPEREDFIVTMFKAAHPPPQPTSKSLKDDEMPPTIYKVRTIGHEEVPVGMFTPQEETHIYFIGTDVETGNEKHFGPCKPLDGIFIAVPIPDRLEK